MVHHKQIQKENLQQLNKDKKGQQHETEIDGVFLIDEILAKKGDKYHIKWTGYTTTTWEPSSSVPPFIRDYYKKTGRSKLPNPRILDSRVCGEYLVLVESSRTFFVFSVQLKSHFVKLISVHKLK